MHKVIGVLEWMGASGRALDDASCDALLATLDDSLRSALVAGDAAALATGLGARLTLACMVVAPDNEPEPLEPVREPDGDEPFEPDADAA
jgi:hypothetical protein